MQCTGFSSDFTIDNLIDFFADNQHGFDEFVQFDFGFRFGWFDHQCAGNRERHGGGMETKIHQALGDIFFADAACFFEWSQIQQTFVRNKTVSAFI